MNEKGITQDILAKKIGVDRSSISDWLNKNAKPRRSRFPKIAKYFGVTVQCLADDSLNIEYEGGKHPFAEEVSLTVQQQIDLQNKILKEQGEILKKLQMQMNTLVKDIYGDPAKDIVKAMCSNNPKKKISKK